MNIFDLCSSFRTFQLFSLTNGYFDFVFLSFASIGFKSHSLINIDSSDSSSIGTQFPCSIIGFYAPSARCLLYEFSSRDNYCTMRLLTIHLQTARFLPFSSGLCILIVTTTVFMIMVLLLLPVCITFDFWLFLQT